MANCMAKILMELMGYYNRLFSLMMMQVFLRESLTGYAFQEAKEYWIPRSSRGMTKGAETTKIMVGHGDALKLLSY